MNTYEGSRAEVRKAVVLVATAKGRGQTMAALDDLSAAAQAWKRVLAVSPQTDDIAARRLLRALERAA